ncbi:MAG: hypothetical protein HY782_14575 [Chloroflexi bacterium]|nr:hypothetical protein [Chloroflexota bacterium]
MNSNPIRNFDPQKIAFYEKENYVAYYQKDWPKLLRVSVGLVRETFGLSLWQAIYGAYLMARAEMAFAPYPDNDIPRSQAYVRRFYAFIKKIHNLNFDLDQAARLEVHWWGVHRKLFANPKNDELVDALTDIYALAYGTTRERVRQAAFHRAQGMLYSDYWVNDGKQSSSPLLAQEEEELCKSYAALRDAVAA